MTDFGTGIKLESDFDVAERNGSIETVSGASVLERDIAFTLVRETTPERGRVPDADFAAEIELLTRRVLTRDPRINNVSSLDVDLAPAGAERTAEISLTVTAANGETDALLIDV